MARNLVTDVAGLRVGHADDARLASGVTAIVFEAPAVAAIDARGGGPATHETDLLDPAMTVDHIDALAKPISQPFMLPKRRPRSW